MIQILHLKINMRAKYDKKWCDFLEKVGNGTANLDTTKEETNQEVDLPKEIMANSEAEIIESLFGKKEDPEKKIAKKEFVENSMLLTVENRTTFELNTRVNFLLILNNCIFRFYNY